MEVAQLFTVALGLQEPWQIERIEFAGTDTERILHLYLGHTKGQKFHYENKEYPVYDHQERTWRHLNFFEHECYLHARVPRVKIENGAVRMVDVPWATPGSSFTLLFEAYALLLVQGGLPVSKAGDYMEINFRCSSSPP